MMGPCLAAACRALENVEPVATYFWIASNACTDTYQLCASARSIFEWSDGRYCTPSVWGVFRATPRGRSFPFVTLAPSPWERQDSGPDGIRQVGGRGRSEALERRHRPALFCYRLRGY